MRRVPAAAKARPIAATASHQALIVMAAGLSLGVTAFAADRYVSGPQHRMIPFLSELASPAPDAVADGQSDEDLYTGSILYMPPDGAHCRQLLFDNQTGALSDNGYVDCGRAAYNGLDGPKHWSAARIRVIATGFRGN